MNSTPNGKLYDNTSSFFEPIFFETPRVRRFYESNFGLSDEKPDNFRHMIFKLIESPADSQSKAKKNFLMHRNTDPFSDSLDFTSTTKKGSVDSFIEPFNHEITPVKMEASVQQFIEETADTHMQREESAEHNAMCQKLFSDVEITRPAEAPENKVQEAQVQPQAEPEDQIEEEPKEQEHQQYSEHPKYSDRMFKFNFDDKDVETRKRKRKSSDQLKILQVEYEKDDAWDKDKISAVAKITKLSESQVYKWCWDQKKKGGAIPSKDSKMKFSLFDDKENIYHREGSGLMDQSKVIQKLPKESRPLSNLKVNREFRVQQNNYYESVNNDFLF